MAVALSLHHILRPRLAVALKPSAALPLLRRRRPTSLPLFSAAARAASSSTATQAEEDAAPPQSSPEKRGSVSSSVIDVNPPRGTRDFLPEDMRLRNWLFQNFREVSRLLTFEEVDFPVLESEALFIRKAGEEITQQGLSAGLLRVLTNKAIEANDGKPLPLFQKAFIGLTAGAIGSCFGSPADLALIRMQADATLPAAQRRHYKNAFHALYRIAADEGVLALWKGAGPTVTRAMALNMGMLASYDQSVEFFRGSLGFGEIPTVLGASAVSGFFASACSLPFDYVKTQIQKMQPDATGKYPYTGSLDCTLKTLKSGGPFKFYTGFPVYFIRIAPHVMMVWIFLDQIQKLEKSVGL